MTRYQFLEVTLNGTNKNPYHAYGLKMNPFPQLAKRELYDAMIQINRLGGDPIPDTDYIREVLKGFSKEFVDLCCAKFVPGKMIKFTVRIPEDEL